MVQSPSTTGPNGANHAADGRFVRGNKAAKGNPLAAKTAKLRATMLNTVSQQDMRAIINAMIERAKRGDVAAAREILDRCMGKPTQGVEFAEKTADGPASGPDPWTADDMQLARMIQKGGLEMPKTLAEKVKRIERQQAEAAGYGEPTTHNGPASKQQAHPPHLVC